MNNTTTFENEKNDPNQFVSLKGLNKCMDLPDLSKDVPPQDPIKNLEMFLKEKSEYVLNYSSKSIYEIGKVISEVKERVQLNSPYDFDKWLDIIDYKKSCAYNHINIYKYLDEHIPEDRECLMKLGMKKLLYLINKRIPYELKERIKNDPSLTVSMIKEQIKKPSLPKEPEESKGFDYFVAHIGGVVNNKRFLELKDTPENSRKIRQIVKILKGLT